MESFFLGFLRPLLLLALFAGAVIPLVMLANKLIPEGKVKRFLFKRR